MRGLHLAGTGALIHSPPDRKGGNKVDEDPSNILVQTIIILALVLLNAFFSAAEIALVSVRRTRIKQLVEEGNSRAVTVQKLLDKPTTFMATVQIGVTLVGFLASAFAAVNIAGVPGPDGSGHWASLLRPRKPLRW
jgi:CBS domain containing-hemolysin-like protein